MTDLKVAQVEKSIKQGSTNRSKCHFLENPPLLTGWWEGTRYWMQVTRCKTSATTLEYRIKIQNVYRRFQNQYESMMPFHSIRKPRAPLWYWNHKQASRYMDAQSRGLSPSPSFFCVPDYRTHRLGPGEEKATRIISSKKPMIYENRSKDMARVVL